MTEVLNGLLSRVDLHAASLVFSVVVVLAGAYLKGYTGFGASMLWMAGLSLVLPPVQIVPMVLMFEVATSITLLPQIWKDVRWSSIGVLLVGTWVATPIGIYALASLPATPIRIALAVAVMIAAVLLLRGFALKRDPGRPATFGVGLVAGVLNGSMGIVGPPVILFYFSSPIGMVAGRASIITYFIGTDSVGMALFSAQGLIPPSVYWRTGVFLPVLIAGVIIGSLGFIRADPEKFRRVALWVLMGLSVLLFARALWSG